jgi:hypothetical protein
MGEERKKRVESERIEKREKWRKGKRENLDMEDRGSEERFRHSKEERQAGLSRATLEISPLISP